MVLKFLGGKQELGRPSKATVAVCAGIFVASILVTIGIVSYDPPVATTEQPPPASTEPQVQAPRGKYGKETALLGGALHVTVSAPTVGPKFPGIEDKGNPLLVDITLRATSNADPIPLGRITANYYSPDGVWTDQVMTGFGDPDRVLTAGNTATWNDVQIWPAIGQGGGPEVSSPQPGGMLTLIMDDIEIGVFSA